MPKAQRDDLSEVWGEELLSLGDENRSNFERQNAIGKPMGNVPMPEEDDAGSLCWKPRQNAISEA